MSCFKPVSAVITNRKTKNGKDVISFSKNADGIPTKVPCGGCIGCRLDHSREWATRMIHEAQLHEENCFITLTYNDENIPPDGSLKKSDIQKFLKRFRKTQEAPYCVIDEKCNPVLYTRGKKKGQPKMATATVKRTPYYYAGEYGEKNNRQYYVLKLHRTVF